MIEKVAQTVKHNVKTSIGITTVVAMLGLYTALTQVLDLRYALAEEARQVQRTMNEYIKQELLDKILIIDLKEQDDQATKVDKAMRKQYKLRLQEEHGK